MAGCSYSTVPAKDLPSPRGGHQEQPGQLVDLPVALWSWTSPSSLSCRHKVHQGRGMHRGPVGVLQDKEAGQLLENNRGCRGFIEVMPPICVAVPNSAVLMEQLEQVVGSICAILDLLTCSLVSP